MIVEEAFDNRDKWRILESMTEEQYACKVENFAFWFRGV